MNRMNKFNLDMKSRYRTLLNLVLCFLLTGLTINIKAQNKYPIGGKLKHEKTKEPVVGATVFAIGSDSSVAAGSVSDENGAFSIMLGRGEYTVRTRIEYASPVVGKISF